MAKRRRQKEQNRISKAGRGIVTPSAATIFRAKHLDLVAVQSLRKLQARLKEQLWERDAEKVLRIEAAQTVEEMLDVVDLATGMGEDAWQDRMRKFGSEALPVIERGLMEVLDLPDPNHRDIAQEMLVGELRWRGRAGARVLLGCFSSLDEYGKCLASVVLGLLEARESADMVWEFYQEAVRLKGESLFTGALWGLIDLKDQRAAQALAQLFAEGRDFYEIYGFLALAGDERAVLPMLLRMGEVEEEERQEIFMSLAGIAHRLGREKLLAEIRKIAPKDTTAEEIEQLGANFFEVSPEQVVETFEIYYRGWGKLENGDGV